MTRKIPWWDHLNNAERQQYLEAVNAYAERAGCPHCIMATLTNRGVARAKLRRRQKQEGRPVRAYRKSEMREMVDG